MKPRRTLNSPPPAPDQAATRKICLAISAAAILAVPAIIVLASPSREPDSRLKFQQDLRRQQQEQRAQNYREHIKPELPR